MGLGGVAVQHADHPLAHGQWHAQQRAQPFLPGDVGVAVAWVRRDVQNGHRPLCLGHPADDPLAQFQRGFVAVGGREVLCRSQLQLAAVFVEQHQRAEPRLHHPGRHLDHHVQHLVQVPGRGDGLAHLGQGGKLGDLALHPLVEHRLLQGTGRQVGDQAQQLHLLPREFVVPARLDVHSADDAPLVDQRHRQQGLEARLLGFRQVFETGVAGRVSLRHRLPGLGCPAGQSLAEPQVRLAYGFGRQSGGGLEHQTLAVPVQQVDGTGVHAHHLCAPAGDQVQCRVQFPRGVDRPADLSQGSQLRRFLFELVFQAVHVPSLVCYLSR